MLAARIGLGVRGIRPFSTSSFMPVNKIPSPRIPFPDEPAEFPAADLKPYLLALRSVTFHTRKHFFDLGAQIHKAGALDVSVSGDQEHIALVESGTSSACGLGGFAASLEAQVSNPSRSMVVAFRNIGGSVGALAHLTDDDLEPMMQTLRDLNWGNTPTRAHLIASSRCNSYLLAGVCDELFRMPELRIGPSRIDLPNIPFVVNLDARDVSSDPTKFLGKVTYSFLNV